MNLFSLDALLGSGSTKIIEESRIDDLKQRDEMLVWADHSGPLKISRVSSTGGDFYCLRMEGEMAVDVMPGGLIVRSVPGIPRSTVDHFLADQVFPRLLAEKGELVVHAGAVRANGCALLFLGPSGSGKSTLVTSLQKDGLKLMGDDAVVIAATPEGPLARAVYPSLRLFPDSISALFTEPVSSRDMSHYSSKQRLDVSVDATVDGAVPVKAIFVLGSDAPIDLRPMSAAQACMAIVENSFALNPSDRDQARGRLAGASQLARELPVFELSYPRAFASLPEVGKAILSAVARNDLRR